MHRRKQRIGNGDIPVPEPPERSHYRRRNRSRPDCYFAEGSEQMLISPGALDMAGVIVTTRQEDFDKITEEKVASIIKEVGITVEEAEKIPGRYFDEKAKR